MKTFYVVEGRGKETGIWSTEYVADSDENATFDTEGDAQNFIDAMVRENGWDANRMRIVEVENE